MAAIRRFLADALEISKAPLAGGGRASRRRARLVPARPLAGPCRDGAEDQRPFPDWWRDWSIVREKG